MDSLLERRFDGSFREFGESAVKKPVKSSIYARLLTARHGGVRFYLRHFGMESICASCIVRNKRFESLQDLPWEGIQRRFDQEDQLWSFLCHVDRRL